MEMRVHDGSETAAATSRTIRVDNTPPAQVSAGVTDGEGPPGFESPLDELFVEGARFQEPSAKERAQQAKEFQRQLTDLTGQIERVGDGIRDVDQR